MKSTFYHRFIHSPIHMLYNIYVCYNSNLQEDFRLTIKFKLGSLKNHEESVWSTKF